MFRTNVGATARGEEDVVASMWRLLKHQAEGQRALSCGAVSKRVVYIPAARLPQLKFAIQFLHGFHNTTVFQFGIGKHGGTGKSLLS